jgi:CPA1 family monovalent cation:H+ antiporter
MLSITSILAFFVLLLISSVTFFAAKRLRVPYTVLLVLVGLALVPITQLAWFEPTLGFLQDFVLTPELLFYVFLPMLIFESAFNMNMRKMVENAWHISLLSVVGLLISATLVAVLLYFGLQLIGLPIPFIIALLFGAIISSTDPVAVLALFKEYHAPKRLTLIFEGESLFNDGTAVALFLVVLAIATQGFHGTSTVLEGFGVFFMMVVLGVAFGIFMATLFSKALRYTRQNEFVSITLLIVSAHMTFILSDLINQNTIFGLHLHISPIIATTVTALFLGTYARHIMSPRSEEYLNKSIEHLAFIANSLVFLLAGLLFASTSIDLGRLWLPIALTIVIVAFARAVSVYAVILPLNRLRPVSKIPKPWQTLLAWGSLRGALAIIVVLLVPDNFVPFGWEYAFTPKELLLALTIGCILATLLIKATTIGKLVIKLGVNKPTPLQQAVLLDTGLYYLRTEQERVNQLATRGYVRDYDVTQLQSSIAAKFSETLEQRSKLVHDHGSKLFVQSLHHMAIAIEVQYLKELYANGEVSETVYRKIKGKLNLQQEKIEYAQHQTIDPSSYTDRKDVFERLVHFSQNAFSRTHETSREESYLYYRAQSIIARKVVKTLSHMQTQYGSAVFLPAAYQTVVGVYETYQTEASTKLAGLEKNHAAELEAFRTELSRKALHATGDKALRFFKQKGMADDAQLEVIDHVFGTNQA